jgi:hypothetical protein
VGAAPVPTRLHAYCLRSSDGAVWWPLVEYGVPISSDEFVPMASDSNGFLMP